MITKNNATIPFNVCLPTYIITRFIIYIRPINTMVETNPYNISFHAFCTKIPYNAIATDNKSTDPNNIIIFKTLTSADLVSLVNDLLDSLDIIILIKPMKIHVTINDKIAGIITTAVAMKHNEAVIRFLAISFIYSMTS
jgi:hypothetical protein